MALAKWIERRKVGTKHFFAYAYGEHGHSTGNFSEGNHTVCYEYWYR